MAEENKGAEKVTVSTMSFADIVRNSLPGGIFLIALLITHPEMSQLEIVPGTESSGVFQATMLFALALLVGALIQSLHRAIPYPFIIRVICLFLSERTRAEAWWKIPLIPLVLTSELEDYRRKFQAARADANIVAWHGKWSDQTHFLYGSGWACFAATYVPCLFGLTPEYAYSMTVIAVVIFAAAIVDDFRNTKFALVFIDEARRHK